MGAPADAVWDVISSPGNLAYCHPFCKENPVNRWPGEGAQDVIDYYSGWILVRNFINWLPGTGYDLNIGREGGRHTQVSWRIEPRQDADSTLTITLKTPQLQRLPVAVRWAPHYLYLRPMLRRYLLSVLKGFEFYIKTGQAVERNQFGSHPWFSPRVTQ
jgi:hypothetical protein